MWRVGTKVAGERTCPVSMVITRRSRSMPVWPLPRLQPIRSRRVCSRSPRWATTTWRAWSARPLAWARRQRWQAPSLRSSPRPTRRSRAASLTRCAVGRPPVRGRSSHASTMGARRRAAPPTSRPRSSRPRSPLPPAPARPRSGPRRASGSRSTTRRTLPRARRTNGAGLRWTRTSRTSARTPRGPAPTCRSSPCRSGPSPPLRDWPTWSTRRTTGSMGRRSTSRSTTSPSPGTSSTSRPAPGRRTPSVVSRASMSVTRSPSALTSARSKARRTSGSSRSSGRRERRRPRVRGRARPTSGRGSSRTAATSTSTPR